MTKYEFMKQANKQRYVFIGYDSEGKTFLAYLKPDRKHERYVINWKMYIDMSNYFENVQDCYNYFSQLHVFDYIHYVKELPKYVDYEKEYDKIYLNLKERN